MLPDKERVLQPVSHARMWISACQTAFQVMRNPAEQGDALWRVEPDDRVGECGQLLCPPQIDTFCNRGKLGRNEIDVPDA